MKKLILALFTISTIFTLSSCGSDDPQKVEKFFSGTALHTKDLKGFKGDGATITTEIAALEDLLKGSTGYGAPISQCELSIPHCEVNIVGLKEGVTLNNFKLTMGNLTKEFGNISGVGSDPKSLITNETLSFFQQIFDKTAKEKKISAIVINFTPSEDIKTEDNVKLEIILKGTFSYWQVVE